MVVWGLRPRLRSPAPGSGNDNISFASINQSHTIELSGLLDINIKAGAGKDNINVDLGGPGGFTDDDPFELRATNRAFRMRIDGGTGPDTIDVNLSNAKTATFAYDVQIQGGSKTNDITFVGVNPGGSPNFGPTSSVLIDGGGGQSDVDVFGNFPVQVLNGVSGSSIPGSRTWFGRAHVEFRAFAASAGFPALSGKRLRCENALFAFAVGIARIDAL
jgi:hypothetical protein